MVQRALLEFHRTTEQLIGIACAQPPIQTCAHISQLILQLLHLAVFGMTATTLIRVLGGQALPSRKLVEYLAPFFDIVQHLAVLFAHRLNLLRCQFHREARRRALHTRLKRRNRTGRGVLRALRALLSREGLGKRTGNGRRCHDR